MARCCYCRIETVKMFKGVPCCEGCMARCVCSSCCELHHRFQLNYFGEDGVCDDCLSEIMDEIDEEHDPEWLPSDSGVEN